MSFIQKLTNEIKSTNKYLEALKLNFPHCLGMDVKYEFDKFQNDLDYKIIIMVGVR